MFLGDTLVSLVGTMVRHMDDLFTALDGGLIGKSVPARILRSGRLEELTVTPAVHP